MRYWTRLQDDGDRCGIWIGPFITREDALQHGNDVWFINYTSMIKIDLNK